MRHTTSRLACCGSPQLPISIVSSLLASTIAFILNGGSLPRACSGYQHAWPAATSDDSFAHDCDRGLRNGLPDRNSDKANTPADTDAGRSDDRFA